MRLAATAFVLLAAAAAAVAKPPGGADERSAALYRLQGVGACVAAHTAGRNYEADDAHILADCECAIDRFIAGRDVAGLPRIIPGQDKGLLDQPFAECRAERRGEAAPRAADAAPAASDAPAPAASADESKRSGFDPLAWLPSVDLPSIGLPRWAWAAIPAAIVLLVLMLRRRRRSDDLLGPPPSLRPGARPGPRSTWPIDEP